jgi:copper chaperone
MSTRTPTVEGMTCGHCVSAVSDEISKIPDVSDVRVDLTAQTATVSGAVVDDAALS